MTLAYSFGPCSHWTYSYHIPSAIEHFSFRKLETYVRFLGYMLWPGNPWKYKQYLPRFPGFLLPAGLPETEKSSLRNYWKPENFLHKSYLSSLTNIDLDSDTVILSLKFGSIINSHPNLHDQIKYISSELIKSDHPRARAWPGVLGCFRTLKCHF